MDLIILVLGIVLLISGIVMIWLRWCCDEMVALSWLMFFGGILLTIVGYFGEPINLLIWK